MTYQPKSEFLRTIVARGFLADCTDLQGLDERLLKGPVTCYIGYDATAQSLHVGHLLNIMLLRWWQKTGNRPITLMGGGTTKVGDPSFRAEERPLLSSAQIDANIAGMQRVFARYLSYGDAPDGAAMLNNAAWLDDLNYLEFLRDIGRHFSVNRMLSFDSVRSRLDREQSLSFLEFNYMILQAYDFLELHRREGCALQMGGSDQWGNIVNGVDLTRRVLDAEVFGLTTPLLTTSDGRKMGKSQGGAIWLDGELLSPYAFWQFWRNTTDADVGRFLRLYTDIPLGECARLGALAGSEINEAKIVLANAVTTLLHGAEAAAAAEATAREVFEKGGAGEDLPTLTLSAADLSDGISVVQLITRSGLSNSGKEAKRLIAEGGARLNDAPLTDAGLIIGADDLARPLKLSAGRKRHALVVLAD
jgi:tyrosyl-tRNA synthetase